MRRLFFAVTALSLVAAAAQAQFPRGGMGGGGMGRGGERGQRDQADKPPAPPTRADLEKQDPILVLVANRKALSLSDSQVTKLESADAELMMKNQPLMSQLDSLNTAGAEPTTMFMVARAVRRNYDDAAANVLKLLTDDQRPKAGKMLEDARPKEPQRPRRERQE